MKYPRDISLHGVIELFYYILQLHYSLIDIYFWYSAYHIFMNMEPQWSRPGEFFMYKLLYSKTRSKNGFQ